MTYRSGLKKYKVPYLPEKVLEEHANVLLDEWRQKQGDVSLPIPLDDLVELHLGLTYEVEDLQSRFGTADILGAIWFNDGSIRINSSLDPHHHPAMLGRFNFTLAHEIGHWRLHRQHLRNDPNAATLFEPNSDPAFVCRDNDSKPEEWQANYFAGCLLMPRRMVRDVWLDWRGDDEPVSVTELDIGAYHETRKRNEETAMEQFCKPLAKRFAVSSQAMRIRLQALEMLVKEKEPRLF